MNAKADLESAVLKVAYDLGDEAYGASIRQALAKGGHRVSIGRVYLALERLERDQMISSQFAENVSRPKRLVKVEGPGVAALRGQA